MRLLITGASGQLGGYLLREARNQTIHVAAWSHSRSGLLFGQTLRPVDLTDLTQVALAFREASPTAVLHLAALTAVGMCHAEPARAEAINVCGTETLAALAAGARARLVMVSTDLVFDGENSPYKECDQANPLSVYGHTKLAAESAALAAPAAAVARLSLMFGPTVIGKPAFFDQQCSKMRAGRKVTWFADEWRTPLSLATAARALLALVCSDFTGLIHIGGPERMSRFEVGMRLAHYLGTDPEMVVAVTRDSVQGLEPRPCDTSLDSTLWRSLYPGQWWPEWENAMKEMENQFSAG